MFPLKLINIFQGISINAFIEVFNWGIIFLFNFVFVSSKYLNSLRMTTDLIYNELPKRKSFKEKIKVFLLVITILIIITTLIVISFGMIKLWLNAIGSINYFILKIIEFILTYSVITMIGMFVFKYTIPIYVEFSSAFKISLVLSLIWVLFSTLYQNITSLLKNLLKSYIIGESILFIYCLYFLNYIIILLIFYYYIKVKQKSKNYE